MRSAKEAVAYMKKVHTLVRYLGICDGNMQEGSFRCDANVSVRPAGPGVARHARRDQEPELLPLRRARDQPRGRAPGRAARTAAASVVQETRLYDPDRNETRAMRSKEEANDYRYFPDPDLLPLVIDDALIEQVRASLPGAARTRRPRGSAATSSCPPTTRACSPRAASWRRTSRPSSRRSAASPSSRPTG